MYFYPELRSETYGYNRFVELIVCGYLPDDSAAPWYYIDFYFNDPDDAGVNSVDANADAPAVFYDLTGKRVDNPSNGIFIRKQGSVVKKVTIKK